MINRKLYEKELDNIVKNYRDKEELTNKSFLITGATGMIGSELVNALMRMDNGAKVYAMGRSLSKLKAVFFAYINNSSFHFLEQNLNETIEIERLNIDYIIHCAAITQPSVFASSPKKLCLII